MHGNRVIVGAFADDDKASQSGSAYIYAHDSGNWVQEAKLLPDDGAAGDLFGIAVAIYGDKVIVGARDDDDRGNNSGSAYIYTHDGSDWVQEAKLVVPTDEAAYDEFGYAVAIYGDKVIVGAQRDDDKGTNSVSTVPYPFFENLIFTTRTSIL